MSTEIQAWVHTYNLSLHRFEKQHNEIAHTDILFANDQEYSVKF